MVPYANVVPVNPYHLRLKGLSVLRKVFVFFLHLPLIVSIFFEVPISTNTTLVNMYFRKYLVCLLLFLCKFDLDWLTCIYLNNVYIVSYCK